MPLGKDLAWATLPQPPGAPRALNNAQHAALYYASELALHINIFELPDGQFAAVPARPPPAHSGGAQGEANVPKNPPAPPRDGEPRAAWVALIEDHPDRFVLGSDVVGHFDSIGAILGEYRPLLDALPKPVADKLRAENARALLPERGAVAED